MRTQKSKIHHPQVSVIIPTYQRCNSLARLLEALAAQTLAPDEFEAVVVVDGSVDKTYAMLQQSRTSYHLLILNQPNRGRSAARNAGIRLAEGELLVFLDDDMEPHPGCLQGHLSAHRSNPRAVVLGPDPVILDDVSPPVTAYIAQKFSEHLENLSRPDHQFQLRDFVGNNFSIYRQELLEVGLFDESFQEYGSEDVELFYRMLKAGLKPVYASDAVAYQSYDKDMRELAKDSFEKGRSAVHLAAIHPDAFPGLKLATFNQASRKQRLVLSILIKAGQIFPGLPQRLLRLLGWLERYNPRSMFRWYRLMVDYFYWYGAASAQSPSFPVRLDFEVSEALKRS